MKKNGFIATSLIYTFFIVFLMLMLFLLNSYSKNRIRLDEYRNDLKSSFAEESLGDLNVNIMVWNDQLKEYELRDNVPGIGYRYQPSPISYCQKNSSIDYNNGLISVAANKKDSCYAYFRSLEKDIILNIYTKESENADKVLVRKVPNRNYELLSKSCTNDAKIDFNENTRTFSINAPNKTECEVVFIKKEADIRIHFYKEDVTGNHLYNNLKYKEVSDIDRSQYNFDSYTCVNSDIKTTISEESNELIIESNGKNECNVYYNGKYGKVEMVIMQETTEGVNGYTTGKKYSRTTGIPGFGYRYVGYICDSEDAKVTFSNGILEAESNEQTVCRAYFEKTSGNAFIINYLETSNGNYERVGIVPSLGYKYNSGRSHCEKGSVMMVDGTTVIVDAKEEDTCHAYFDLIVPDIKINIYVLNRATKVYELGEVPVAGYDFYSDGCTNGGKIDYKNGALKVDSANPTVCTVYFR